MSARVDPPDPETDDLRRVVEDVAGVASAEVVRGDVGRPTVRVHLDGSDEPQRVLDAVRSAVNGWRNPAPRLISDEAPRPRRAGLGKGLDVLLAEAAAGPIDAAPVAAAPVSLVDVTVQHGEFGSTIRAIDSEGTIAVVLGVGGNIDQAVVSAVATLRDREVPEVLGVDDRTVGGHRVVTVVTRGAGGSAGVASATVTGERSLAVGEAAWSLLER